MPFTPGTRPTNNTMRHSILAALIDFSNELLATPDADLPDGEIGVNAKLVKRALDRGRKNERDKPVRPGGHQGIDAGEAINMHDTVQAFGVHGGFERIRHRSDGSQLKATMQDEVIGMVNLILLRGNAAPQNPFDTYKKLGAEIRAGLGVNAGPRTSSHDNGSLVALAAIGLGDLLDDVPAALGTYAGMARDEAEEVDRLPIVRGTLTFPVESERERLALLTLHLNYVMFTDGVLPKDASVENLVRHANAVLEPVLTMD